MNDLSSNAFAMRMERRDGAGAALTSHDRALTVDGIPHDPGATITPNAVRAALDGKGDDGGVEGAIASDAIEQDDLKAGRWDGAKIGISTLDWESGAVIAERYLGELATVRIEGEHFAADLSSPFAILDRPPCPETSPHCRARFGDASCRVDLAGRRTLAEVTSTSGNRIVVNEGVDDVLAFGEMRVLSGPARNARLHIAAIDSSEIVLRDEPPVPIEVGTRVMLSEGCDKRFATCRDRFANAANFRGEPHLPGADLLTRYPGS